MTETQYIVSVFGVRIKADSEAEIEQIEENIDYLTDFQGIGHVTGAELVKSFNNDLERILDASIDDVLPVPGIGEKTAENLIDRITSEEDKIRRMRENHSPTLDEVEESDPFDMKEEGKFELDPIDERMKEASGE